MKKTLPAVVIGAFVLGWTLWPPRGLAHVTTTNTVLFEREIVRILRLSDVQERLKGLGSEAIPSTPEHAATFIAGESAKWAKVIQDTGTRLD